MPTAAAPSLTSRHGSFACGNRLPGSAPPRDGAVWRGSREVVTVRAAKGKKGGAGSSGGGGSGGGSGGGGGKFKSPGEVKEGAAYAQETRRENG